MMVRRGGMKGIKLAMDQMVESESNRMSAEGSLRGQDGAKRRKGEGGRDWLCGRHR